MIEPAKSRPDLAASEGQDPPFRLTRGWLIVGLVAVALGIACGLVMSTATFVR
jgi:hypothetical protein